MATVALLGRTSEFARCRIGMKDDVEFIANTTQQDADVISQVASKTSCCSMPASPGSTITMTPMTSLVTSAATASTVSCEPSRLRTGSPPKHCDQNPAVVQLPCPTEDGVEFDDEDHEVRLPYMRLRTDSGIGMPVWDSSMSPASRLYVLTEPTGDVEAAVDVSATMPLAMYSDSWSFGMPASYVPMEPLVMPTMPLATSPSMSAVVSPVMPLPAMIPTMTPFVPLCTSPNVDGHGYGGNAYYQAWPFGDGLGYDSQVYSHSCPTGDGHGYGGRAHSQQVSPSAPQLLQNRKRTCKVDAVRGAEVNQSSPTTICFRNLPNNYSTKMVLDLLDQNGFNERYDFVYVPHDFKRLPSLVNVGYFFVNFVSHEVAVSALEQLAGFKSWMMLSTKVLEGSWAAKTQGKSACRERCKYFTFMHEEIPAECKPMMFEHGVA